MSDPVIRSYIHAHGRVWFVSTIERDSSAIYNPSRYHETCVWVMEGDARGDMIGTFGSDRGNLLMHFKVCENLYKNGDVPSE